MKWTIDYHNETFALGFDEMLLIARYYKWNSDHMVSYFDDASDETKYKIGLEFNPNLNLDYNCQENCLCGKEMLTV